MSSRDKGEGRKVAAPTSAVEEASVAEESERQGPAGRHQLGTAERPDEELIAEVALNLNKAPAVPVALGLVDRIKNAEQLSSELQPGNQAPEMTSTPP